MIRRSSIGAFLASSVALIVVPRLAHAEPPPAEDGAPTEPSGATVPVRIEAGSDALTIDDVRCRRGTCEGRFAPGRHLVKREVAKDGEYVVEASQEIDIAEPTVVSVQGPGFLRKTAVVTLVAGATLVLAGVIVPLVLCRNNDTTDPTTGQVRTDRPCDGVSNGVKLAWIGGVGIGLTLVTLGLIGYATTSGATEVKTSRWALVPTLGPARHEGRVVPAGGLGLTLAF